MIIASALQKNKSSLKGRVKFFVNFGERNFFRQIEKKHREKQADTQLIVDYN